MLAPERQPFGKKLRYASDKMGLLGWEALHRNTPFGANAQALPLSSGTMRTSIGIKLLGVVTRRQCTQHYLLMTSQASDRIEVRL